MRGRKTLALCLLALTLCLLPGIASADSYGDLSKAKYVWKTATMAPKGIGYAILFEQILLPMLKKETGGDVYLKIYWGGIMGDDKQVLKKLQINQLQGAGLSGQGTFMISPEIPVLGLPFLFNDYDEVYYIKTKMIDRFDEITQQHGLKILLWQDQDFDQIYTAKKPLTKLEDFSKCQFATWFGPLEGKFLERMGTSAVPMDVTEIPASMRAGVADAMIAPSIWIVGTQLYTTFRYVNPIKVRYVPAFNVVTKKAWSSVKMDYQNKLRDMRLAAAKQFDDKAHVETAKCLNAMLQYGVKECDTTPEDLQKIKDRAIPLADQLAGHLYSKKILDEIRGHLADYRARKKAGK